MRAPVQHGTCFACAMVGIGRSFGHIAGLWATVVLVGCVGQPSLPSPLMETFASEGDASSGTPSDTSGAQGSTGSEQDSTLSTTSDVDTSGASDTAGTSTGGATDDCADPPPYTTILSVEEAVIQRPMVLGVGSRRGPYAYSETEQQGRVSFEFTAPCEDEYWAFAHVYDPGVGASGLDVGQPDSYRVSFDSDSESLWSYGCQTFDIGLSGWLWSWQPVVSHTACLEDSFHRTLMPGAHLFHLSNVEAGTHMPSKIGSLGNVAAVSSVIITNDPTFTP